MTPSRPVSDPAVDEAAIATAKSKVGRAAKATVASVRQFAERATALLSAPNTLRESARQQTAILANQQVHQALRDRPVTALRDVAGKGARLGALRDAGFRTVADVASTSPYRLQAVPGIGPQTAQQVSEAARLVGEQVAKEARFRFDPDRRDPGQTQLLATLAAARHADDAASSLQGPLQQFTEQTKPLVEEAERAGSRISMLFSRRRKKRATLSALNQLDSILADPQVVSLEQTMDRLEPAIHPASYSAEQLWRDYAADAASFNALLSTIGGAGESDDIEATQGFIPEELRQKIEAVPLDASLLKATLRGYQLFGAQYAIHQQHSILGDEMGLGKTVEALAVFTHLAVKGQRRFLVVCPASVQINWLNEIRKHTQLDAFSLHGADREARARRWLQAGGVAVTTFGTVDRLEAIKRHDVAMLVIDEAHFVKNPDAKRSKAVNEVLGRAQRALFLTGTPMENRVEEFRNLVGYLQPRVARGVEVKDTLGGAKAFRRAVAPVYLRRNQEDVLTELPDKIEIEDWVQLSSADDAAYAAAVRSRNLMRMRQAAFHSAESAKLERLCDIVEEAQQDDRKVIVYSYFLQVLKAIREGLGDAVMGPLTGSVSSSDRQHLVDLFTQRGGHAALLAQIEAGGVGLNLQAGSVVILAEPQWKPSTEEQAIARAYRMGQISKVQVHRLLAKGSVDERLREVQEEKSLLFDAYARKSDAKNADSLAVDASEQRPALLDDGAVPLEKRIIMAEQHRLGMT